LLRTCLSLGTFERRAPYLAVPLRSACGHSSTSVTLDSSRHSETRSMGAERDIDWLAVVEEIGREPSFTGCDGDTAASLSACGRGARGEGETQRAGVRAAAPAGVVPASAPLRHSVHVICAPPWREGQDIACCEELRCVPQVRGGQVADDAREFEFPCIHDLPVEMGSFGFPTGDPLAVPVAQPRPLTTSGRGVESSVAPVHNSMDALSGLEPLGHPGLPRSVSALEEVFRVAEAKADEFADFLSALDPDDRGHGDTDCTDQELLNGPAAAGETATVMDTFGVERPRDRSRVVADALREIVSRAEVGCQHPSAHPHRAKQVSAGRDPPRSVAPPKRPHPSCRRRLRPWRRSWPTSSRRFNSATDPTRWLSSLPPVGLHRGVVVLVVAEAPPEDIHAPA